MAILPDEPLIRVCVWKLRSDFGAARRGQLRQGRGRVRLAEKVGKHKRRVGSAGRTHAPGRRRLGWLAPRIEAMLPDTVPEHAYRLRGAARRARRYRPGLEAADMATIALSATTAGLTPASWPIGPVAIP
jgi:hypothetical protein